MNANTKTASDEQLPEFSSLCRYMSERAPQPMVAVEGLTHIVRYINPAFCALVGKTKSELLDMPFAKAVPEVAQNDCLDILCRVFRTGESEILVEQAHGSKEGCFWSYAFWAILNLDEQPIGVMIQITDTSEAAAFRKRSVEVNEALVISSIRQHELTSTALELNKELVAATEIKNQFLAAMSHEIRTPLNAIMGFSELLALSDQTADERYIYGERMKRNAVLLLRLINDILDLSKVESGKLQIEKIDTNLPELFSDVRMVMSHLAEEKGVSFFMTGTNILPDIVTTDPTRLKQILINVVGNAVKFTSEGAVRLVTSVDQMSRKCSITVSDTGEGMSSEQSAKIFYPFMQGDATTTRKFGGTGLGLDLARRLAKALGGDVVLLESSPGKGSVFEITFALENPRYKGQVKASERKSKEKIPTLNGIRVLLAEDAPDNQLLMTKFLTLAGASVELASDGEEVVSKSQSDDYDIILMDIQMPKLDGYAATARIRDDGYKGPIVALTAHAMRDEIERCWQMGCDDHLAKPVTMLELCDMVHRLVIGQVKTSKHPFDRRKAIFSLKEELH